VKKEPVPISNLPSCAVDISRCVRQRVQQGDSAGAYYLLRRQRAFIENCAKEPLTPPEAAALCTSLNMILQEYALIKKEIEGLQNKIEREMEEVRIRLRAYRRYTGGQNLSPRCINKRA